MIGEMIAEVSKDVFVADPGDDALSGPRNSAPGSNATSTCSDTLRRLLLLLPARRSQSRTLLKSAWRLLKDLCLHTSLKRGLGILTA